MGKRATHEEFICVCNDDGKTEAAALMVDVKRRLSARFEEETTDGNLLSHAVWSLELDFNAQLNGIFTDQWSAVSAARYDKTFTSWIQCDVVEHGVAATWRAFADNLDTEDGERL